MQKFLSDFLETQAFAVFLEKHYQLPNNIFDEAAAAYAENTTESMWDLFASLSSNRGKIRETVEVKPPDLSGLDVTGMHRKGNVHQRIIFSATYPNYGFTRLHQDLYGAPQILEANGTTPSVTPPPVVPLTKPADKADREITEGLSLVCTYS